MKFENKIQEISIFGLIIVAVVSAISYLPTECANRHGIKPSKYLIIDTDGVPDDAIAILMAVRAESLDNGPKVIAITCVNGNTFVQNCAINVLKTLKIIGRLDIPVYVGAEHPILLPYYKNFSFYGKDGLNDFHYPDPPPRSLIKTESAVSAMINIVRQHRGEVTIIAIAPLTNIAIAIRLYPDLLLDAHQVIVMGGATNGHGNIIPGVDANSYADPASNYVLFNSAGKSTPVILVPLETTISVRVRMDFRIALTKKQNPIGWLIDNAERDSTLDPNAEYWFCPDAVAMVVATTLGCIVTKSEYYYMDAIYEGVKTAGLTIVDFENVTKKASNINLIQEINSETYHRLLTRYLS